MADIASPETLTLQFTRHYPAPPARVFEAWTNPTALKAWFAPSPEAKMPTVDVDLRVGGAYRFLIQNPDGQEHCVTGVYREIVPPTRLVFTWTWAAAPDRESTVIVELRPDDEGTELVLTHQGLHEGTEFTNHEHGWSTNLTRLSQLAW